MQFRDMKPIGDCYAHRIHLLQMEPSRLRLLQRYLFNMRGWHQWRFKGWQPWSE